MRATGRVGILAAMMMMTAACGGGPAATAPATTTAPVSGAGDPVASSSPTPSPTPSPSPSPSPTPAPAPTPVAAYDEEPPILRAKVTKRSICDKDHVTDCVGLASDLQYGRGVKKDRAKALAYYRIACDANDAGACLDVADMATDDAEELAFLRRACELKRCMQLAWKLIDSDVRTERDEALTILATICDRGHPESRPVACQQRGDRADTIADGVPWLEKGCKLDNDDACLRVAQHHLNDRYPGSTPTKSTRALEKMCERRIIHGCRFAGDRHIGGAGVPKSRDQADKYLRKACDLGGEPECDALKRRGL